MRRFIGYDRRLLRPVEDPSHERLRFHLVQWLRGHRNLAPAARTALLDPGHEALRRAAVAGVAATDLPERRTDDLLRHAVARHATSGLRKLGARFRGRRL